jgi:quercetin dioxygenase-like cupin family protein
MPHPSSAHPATLGPVIVAPPGRRGPARASPADAAEHVAELRARLVTLPAHEVRRLHPAARVRTLRGTLWLTVDGVGEDIVLEAGETWRFEGGRRVLACALGGEASFEVCEPGPAASRGLAGATRARWARLAERLRRVRSAPGGRA